MQYIDPTSEHSLKSLNALCVRLVFCLYAEDAGLFPSHNAFHDYLASFSPEKVRQGLIDLFRILDTKQSERDPYAEPTLLAFPYVNGGLFRDENIEIPRFTPEILHLLLKDCSTDFDWSGISPTIFGAVFESTLNPETRRSGGMHYTSIENIHNVIDPLFLDELKNTLDGLPPKPPCGGMQVCAERRVCFDCGKNNEMQVCAECRVYLDCGKNNEEANFLVQRTRNHIPPHGGFGGRSALLAFQQKLASLTFLDPACGSGNFLTETYLSLRRLENQVLKALRGSDTQLSMVATSRR